VIAESLHLIAAVERQSPVIRGLETAPRPLRTEGNLVVTEGLTEAPDLPLSLSLPGGVVRSDLPEVKADVVVTGRASHRLRMRAFYLEANLTLVVHGRMPLLMRNRLHAGAAVLARVYGQSSLVMPRPHERGRRHRHAWIVEDVLRGRATKSEEWPSVAGRVADGLWEIWTVSDLSMAKAGKVVTRAEISRALDMLAALPGPDWSAASSSRIQEAAQLSGPMTIGWRHGDPLPGNVIQMTDGRLGLVDWEAAERGPIARDAIKVMRWLEDPLPIADALGERVAARTGLSSVEWRGQLLIEALRSLGRSSAQHARAVAKGSTDVAGVVERRRHSMVRLLETLSSAPIGPGPTRPRGAGATDDRID
jgi:hypothetical protein